MTSVRRACVCLPRRRRSVSRWSKDTKYVYRHYATLFFIFAVDESESELGMLDLVQVPCPPATAGGPQEACSGALGGETTNVVVPLMVRPTGRPPFEADLAKKSQALCLYHPPPQVVRWERSSGAFGGETTNGWSL